MADGKTTIEIRLRSAADVSGVNQMQQAIHGLEGAQQRAATSSGNMGQALLQGSRALQDLQYGLAGAVNNLEGIASAMGLGAGVAGAVTVLAVALQTLGPKALDWLRSLDKEGAKLEVLKNAHLGIAEAINQSFNPATEAAKVASEAFTAQIEKEKQAIDDDNKALDHHIKQLRLANAIKDTTEQAAQRGEVEALRAKGLPADEQARGEAAINLKYMQRKQKRDEAAFAEEETAQQMKIDNQRRLAESAQKQLQEQEKLVASAKFAADLLDPKNKGSITGIQEQIREHEKARLINTTEVYVPPVSDKEKALRAELANRQRFLGEFAGKLPGGTLDLSGTEEAKKDNAEKIATLAKSRDEAKQAAEEARKKADDLQRERDLTAPEKQMEAQMRRAKNAQAQAELTAPFEDKPRARRPDAVRVFESNPFDLMQPENTGAARQSRTPRNLIEEERSGSGPKQGLPKNSDITAQGQKSAEAITQMAGEFVNALKIVEDAATKALSQVKNNSGRTGS